MAMAASKMSASTRASGLFIAGPPFSPRCQTTYQRLGRFQHEHEAIEKGADQAAAAYPQIAAARGGYRRRKSWAKSRLSRCKQDWEAFASRPDVAGLRPHIT